jgi:uncharacterized protein (DUF1800 family)
MPFETPLGLIALNRFGLGPRGDGDVAAAASDPRGFLKAELAQPGIALLSGPGLPTTPTAVDQFFQDQTLRQMERAQAAMTSREPPPPGNSAPAMAAMATSTPAPEKKASLDPVNAKPTNAKPANVKPANVKPAAPEQAIFRDEALARVRRGVEARVGFVERLVGFWSNHFCISVAKGGIARVTAGCFEREAIRPHVLGRFSDMLMAVESHPAMLHFLDNAQSVGPNSHVGQRRERGLNENLGREILELHTLGVGSGYTQADVSALAKILTGWSFVGKRGVLGTPGTFVFNAGAHEPGPISLLGKPYPADGLGQGRAALLDLARRPETALFIARKLASAFVADDPPASLVTLLAQVFLNTDGNLRALANALVEAPESWARTPAKMRTPYDFIIATNRLLNHLPDDAGQVLGPLNAMGMGLWAPPGPNGYPSQVAAWASPEGMKLRLDYCARIANRLRDPPNPNELLDALCGGDPSPDTRLAVSRAESRQQGLALVLMSPEMQRS